MRRRFALALVLLTSCGYHPVHAVRDPLGPFAVVAGPVHAPDADLAAAALEGARAELARAGELGDRGAPAAIEIELLRVDETSEGIALSSPGLPLARAVRVTALGRARVRRAGSAAAERDTGDVRASDVVGRGSAAAQALVLRDEAGRAAARRLGEVLVRQLLGFAEPGEP
jgi:hypothetical protein